jgi:predicted lipoprotein with Yx(FWY)xxD motif
VLASATLLLITAGACSQSSGSAASKPTVLASVNLTTGHGQALSPVLAETGGTVLYATAAEAHGKVDCTGNCATTWPLVLVRTAAAIHVGNAALDRASVGTVPGPDGSLVVTYGGYPLHTYVGDGGSAGNGVGVQGYEAVSPKGTLVGGR